MLLNVAPVISDALTYTRYLVGNALAIAGIEIVAFLACADNALASDAANGLSSLDNCAVLAFTDTLASTA